MIINAVTPARTTESMFSIIDFFFSSSILISFLKRSTRLTIPNIITAITKYIGFMVQLSYFVTFLSFTRAFLPTLSLR